MSSRNVRDHRFVIGHLALLRRGRDGVKPPAMLRLAPVLAIAVLLGPILAGLLATLLPAFGWFPALGGDTVSLAPWRALLAKPGLWASAALSFFTGLGSTLAALGIVALFVAGWSGTRAFSRFSHLVSPLLSVPHAAAAFGLAFLIAPSGWLMRLAAPLAGIERPPDWLVIGDPLGLSMSAALVAKEAPFLLLVTLAALPQTDWQRRMAVATSLGYGRIAGFATTVWPTLYPQIRLAVFAVLAYATSVVDVAVILGPSAPPTLAVRLVGWMNDPDLAMRFTASAGAVLQGLVTTAALLAWLGLERLGRLWLDRRLAGGRRGAHERLGRTLGAGAVLASALAVFAGLAVLVLWSFAGPWRFPDILPQTFTLQNWVRAAVGAEAPLRTTLAVGLLATALAAVLATACLEREWRAGATHRKRVRDRLLALVYLPLIVPQVAFVFGLQLFALALGLRPGLALLTAVHFVFVLPYVFLSLSDPWRAWDGRLAQVANGLGRGANGVFWRVRLPMLLRPLLAAAAVGFAVSVGQYLPTVLIGQGRLTTVTTEAVALAAGGNRRVVGTYAVLQMALPFLAFVLATLVPTLLFRNRRGLRAA